MCIRDRSNTVSQRPRLRSHARFLHIAYCVSGVWKSANTQTINQLIRSASERFAAYKFTQGLLANINWAPDLLNPLTEHRTYWVHVLNMWLTMSHVLNMWLTISHVLNMRLTISHVLNMWITISHVLNMWLTKSMYWAQDLPSPCIEHRTYQVHVLSAGLTKPMYWAQDSLSPNIEHGT